jgi:hypothetical protein
MNNQDETQKMREELIRIRRDAISIVRQVEALLDKSKPDNDNLPVSIPPHVTVERSKQGK